MKVILVYGLKNVVGGIENYLLSMQQHLFDDLKFVYIVEDPKVFIYAQQIKDSNGDWVVLPERHNLKDYVTSLNSVLEEYRSITDTIYINVGHISFDIIPILIAIKKGYRVVTHSHSAMQEPIASTSYRIRQTILRTIARTTLSLLNIDRLAVSARSGNYLYKKKPYSIVSPGIDTFRFRYDPKKRNEMLESLGLAGYIVLGFVGRFVPVKNPLFLIDILLAVKKRSQNVKLLLVGDGPLKADLITKAQLAQVDNDVVFVGEVDDVEDYYQVMDVLLAPSLSEGMPLAIMEAQSSGIPCICAKGNFPETIDVTGIVHFSALDTGAEEWAEDIQRLLSQNINREEMNHMFEKSSLNIINASKTLLNVLE